MPNAQNTFVLNDETVVNSHGFRVKNAGISLVRLKANPVILAQHNNSVWSVIGRWENIRIEGSQLLADAVFDTEDAEAAKIAGKVERGFLKGASMGLLPIGDSPFILDSNGIPLLDSSEALESSIVAIPSNRSAVKLYAAEGIEMTMDEIKLSITSKKFTSNNIGMNKITLSVQTLLVLGLQNSDDNVATQNAVETLAVKFKENEVALDASKKQVLELQEKLSKIELSEATALVDKAIADKKLGAEQRDAFLKLASSDLSACKTAIESLTPRAGLPPVKNPDVTNLEVKTEEDFLKLTLDQQLEFKKNNPVEYQNLFK